MTQQDPRVTEDQEVINMFFRIIAGASLGDIASRDNVAAVLAMAPTLAYARDENGDTALYNVVAAGRYEALEIARILMNHGAEPQAVNEQNEGPYYGLKLIEDTDIKIQMAEILRIDFKAAEEAHYAELRAREDAHFNNNHAHKTINKINKGAKIKSDEVNKKPSGDEKCTIMSVHEVNYEQSIKNLFSNMQLNMDQEKELNRMNLELNSLLRDISFHPMVLETASSNDISIIVVPKEILEMGYEQFTNLLGNIYNFCLGLNLDASEQ